MILLIDNYDSFSYNVFQLIGSVEPDIKVVRNDEYTVEEIEKMKKAVNIDYAPVTLDKSDKKVGLSFL